jgi:hypothetical protein
MHRTLARRFGVLIVAGVLAATGLTVATTGAAQASDDAGARWLGKQLTQGLVHNDQYDFDDYGLTADVGLALAEIGGNADKLKSIRRALASRVESWTTGVDFGLSDVYAGSTAKAVVFAETVKKSPRSFGGVNLVRQLNRLVSTTKPTVGRIQDKGSSDFANTIGQAFAAQGLARAKSGKADETLRFLLKQQCERGYFRLNFSPSKTGPQSCDAGTKAESAPDTDTTALALLNLQALPKKTRAVRRAIKHGVSWLKRHQKENGSFGGGPSTQGSNTNSTGLAASALGGAGACGAARQAARWVGKLQLKGGLAGTPLAGERGAIAYDRAALRTAKESGITVETADQWRRATSQSAPGLAFVSVKACRR